MPYVSTHGLVTEGSGTAAVGRFGLGGSLAGLLGVRFKCWDFSVGRGLGGGGIRRGNP